MNNNDRWKFFLVLGLIGLSLYWTYPPTSRDLIQEFSNRADNQDATFSNILAQAESLQKSGANSEFANLREAIGTNDIEKYFGTVNASDPTTFILNQIQRDASGKIKLGLDLQGGTAFLVEMDTNALNEVAVNGNTNGVNQSQNTSAAISQAVEVLRKRVDQFGVAEPVIQPAGANQIWIQLPGLSEAEKESAEVQIQKAAYLEFRLVHERSGEIVDPQTGQILEPIPPGYVVLKHVEPPQNGKQSRPEIVVVKKTAEKDLAGDITTSAIMSRDEMGNPDIVFSLKDSAAKAFAKMTADYTGRQMAIVLDGELQSAPVMQVAILDGNVRITGHYSEESAQQLSHVLQNPLRAPLKIAFKRNVDPTLGKDTIRHGIYASIAAVVFVSLFMLLYYRVAGLTANVALIVNIIILMGVMCSIGTTLTLPGIAGIVLTIGMAVDANVLIYERLREEIAKGKSLRGAIAAGYARAFGTIFDSHVTTLISSVILIFMGTGEIKGFGVTLTIGVAASLFTALVVTRLIFNFMLDRNILKTLSMLHVIKSAKLNFMKVATPLFILSWTFIILSLGFGFTRGEKLFGVDFRGGDSTTFSFAQKLDVDKIRSAVTQIGEKDAQIQYQKDISTGTETLGVTTSSGSGPKVQQTLESQFPQVQFKVINTLQMGASVGKDVRDSAIIASFLAMFGILVYVAFRYEFSFAVAAVIAVFHDVLLAIGAYCIANAISGRQFNATVVAAVLTIIGFSINDKIVIFDRIRED
ncbi:MAG TPA: protein translocase subunit SecD, partial [Methylomirabilota bacterium]|nr:protein translocase subunit SecD [Methylomirabilota bacterium]